MGIPEAMWESFLKMSVEEKAIVLLSIEKMEKGEINEDRTVTFTLEELNAKLSQLTNNGA